MAFVEYPVDFSTGAETQLVPSGNTITSLVAINVPRGITFAVRFGNNQYVSGWSGKVTWDLETDSLPGDASQGLWVKPDAPAPGVIAKFAVSYGR